MRWEFYTKEKCGYLCELNERLEYTRAVMVNDKEKLAAKIEELIKCRREWADIIPDTLAIEYIITEQSKSIIDHIQCECTLALGYNERFWFTYLDPVEYRFEAFEDSSKMCYLFIYDVNGTCIKIIEFEYARDEMLDAVVQIMANIGYKDVWKDWKGMCYNDGTELEAIELQEFAEYFKQKAENGVYKMLAEFNGSIFHMEERR